MSRTTTSVIRCDNCGQVNTSIVEYSHDLPTLATYTGVSPHYIINSTVGPQLDYCPSCVEAVRDAIRAALESRKSA